MPSAAAERRFPGELTATWTVLLFPVRTFERILPRDPVLAPWLVASVLSIVLTIPVVSISQRAAVHLLDDRATPSQIERVEASLGRMKAFSIVGAPVGILARWLVTAAVLWAPAVLVSSGVSFRRVLSIVAYSAVPALLGRGIDLGTAWMSGPEFTPAMVPVFSAATSAAAWLPGLAGAPWLLAALENVTPFSIWGTVLWAIGLQVGHGLRRASSLGIAGGAGLFFLVMSTAASVFTRSALSLAAPPPG